MMKCNFFFNSFLLVFVAILPSTALSFTPTAAQISQFKSLPKAQQEQLAKQYGVDLNTISSASASNGENGKEKIAEPKRATSIQDNSNVESLNLKESDESELPLFGYDLFVGTPMDFTPVDNLPIPLDYVMAPGDEILVQLYGKSNQRYSVTIDRDGKVDFPELGAEYIAGQTFGEIKQYIVSLVERKLIGVEAIVSLGSMRTIQIYVAGEVIQPGAYNVNGLTTLTQAIVASGGVKNNGSLRNIQLKRKGKVVQYFDAYNLLLNGDNSQDVRLQAGDTLFIPTRQASVSVKGEITRPAKYELKGKTTLESMLKMAGGALPDAYLSLVNVRRVSTNGVELITLDFLNNSHRSFVLQPGDEVSLAPVNQSFSNVIAVRGEAIRQGVYSFVPGMKVNDVIKNIEQDLKETADLRYALLVRESIAPRKLRVKQFSLLNAISHPSSEDNLVLQARDQIFIFDNGIDLEYWYRKDKNKKVDVAVSEQAKFVEVVDQTTGALVEVDTTTQLESSGVEQVSKSDRLKKSSRELLLEPIIERLKAQATFDSPAQLIEITGAVKYPGIYPLPDQANFNALIDAAGGFAEHAYLTLAEVTRSQRINDSFDVEHYTISPRKLIDGDMSFDFVAQDSIMVKRQPNWQRDLSIELQGEVKFPGTYAFARGETLSDIIERAGGFTRFAYPKGAVFSRESLKRQEQERLKLLNAQLKQEIGSLALRRQSSSASYTTSPNDAMAITEELAKTEALGRLVIDLKQAVAGDSINNIMLENGDKLYVPALQPIISVMGEVQFASNHTYRPGMSIEDYISAAGGTKKQADTDRVYVIRADGAVILPNSSFWFSRKSKPLEPGDTVVVPIDTDYLDGLSTLTSATQILYQIGVAWSAIKD
ncbi:sugar transporter [Vibrio aestuarianus]|uniref:SLBB domain-containing protein n=1 Tax=Vibrio aestuarianus TaxID=28171 RepID=UPI0015594A6D|nr:SLBB domain-containing protein [Vibrio aestuarianus]NGZ14864.1 sugar transporter [Vibrio aestuarianus]NKZ51012.1 sugar transporter [Vibrio aestuarianus]